MILPQLQVLVLCADAAKPIIVQELSSKIALANDLDTDVAKITIQPVQ
jgi:hypothetical protein